MKMDELAENLNEKNRLPFLILIMLVLIIVSLACNVPIQSFFSGGGDNEQQATDQVATAIAKTLTARPLQDQPDSSGGESGNEGSEEKSPSLTPSITPSPTITSTPTPEQAVAYISQNTNCREGDQEVYGLVHTFLEGDSVNLMGKNNENTYWYVEDQQGGFTECWLWKKFATPEGNTELLPVMYPPPTPTPMVALSIKNRGTSGNKVIVEIQNNGNATLQSYSATYKDKATSETVSLTSNQFGSAASIPIGRNAKVNSPSFSANPKGHKVTVTIKACTEDSMSGWCSSSSASFKAK
jgi:hypothetical protein